MIGSVGISAEREAEELVLSSMASSPPTPLSRWPQSTTTPLGGGVCNSAEEVFFARDLNSQIAAKKQLGGDSSTGYPTRYSGDTKAGHRPRWGTRETRMLDTDRDA